MSSGQMWIRFDTSFPDSPKVLDLLNPPPGGGWDTARGKAAGFTYLCGIAYCGKHGTDGFIPAAALPRINGDADEAALLVEVELWDVAPGGWLTRGWADYQPSSESQAATRAAKRAGAAKGNCVRWHGPDCGCWQRPTDPPQPGSFRPRVVNP